MELLLGILLMCVSPFISGAFLYGAVEMLGNAIAGFPDLNYVQCCLIMLAVSVVTRKQDTKREFKEVVKLWVSSIFNRLICLLVMFLFYVIFF